MIARAAKLLLALTAACGALLLGAWAGGAFAGAAQGRPSRAVDELAYERASAGTIAVGDALVVNGQPMPHPDWLWSGHKANVHLSDYMQRPWFVTVKSPCTWNADPELQINPLAMRLQLVDGHDPSLQVRNLVWH